MLKLKIEIFPKETKWTYVDIEFVPDDGYKNQYIVDIKN